MSPKMPGSSGILKLNIQDKAVLYASYMPFVENGALFIPTKKSYKLGDEVFVLLSLMDEQEKTPIAGKVVWMSPAGVQGSRVAGVGVQLEGGDNSLKAKIETYLAGSVESERLTHTM